uniref:NACHT domain-containing protein n=1 Tax=Astyanax mexicanus TaxID=7994 RepID=A0A8B9J9I7_ASTMX
MSFCGIPDTNRGESLVQSDHAQERSESPESSCVSIKSDQSMDFPQNFKEAECSPAASPVQRDCSQERSESPEQSCVSMKSDQSMDFPQNFKGEEHSPDVSLVQRVWCPERSDLPEPSCVSMKSDQSMDFPQNFRQEEPSPAVSPVQSDWFQKRSESPEPSCVSIRSDQSMDFPQNFRREEHSSDISVQKETSKFTRSNNLETVFKTVEHKLISVLQKELKMYIKLLNADSSACCEKEVEDEEDQSSGREEVLKLTLDVLRNTNNTDLANTLQIKWVSEYQQKLQSKLIEKYTKINEGISQHGRLTFLSEIYTELYITEGESGEVNNEHEVRQIETASRRPATQEKPINCNDLFKDKPVRTVLTKGVAGIGKTVSVQKFILDWAEGKANQDIHFIFPLPFRELNLMKKEKLTLMELLHHFFPEIKKLKSLAFDAYRVLFIFDGLDECRLPLDFQNNVILRNATDFASVDVLLTNLIRGNLLSSALLWITSRPAAASQISLDCINQVTEIRGFTDHQKEEYFSKRISDQTLAKNIISHMKSLRSLYIMCHIPVFCWIAATVLERVLGKAETGEIPKTLTQMFTHFLIFQIKHRNQKYKGKCDPDPQETKRMILALGKLAFQQLEKGNLIFYEEDLRECGIDVSEVSVYSGVCTQIFKEELGLHLGKVFSFVHLSVQEFLAALYAFLTFISKDGPKRSLYVFFGISKKSKMSDFLRSAADKALQSENGHLDLFLRFLLGLSVESNQVLLRGLLAFTERCFHSKEGTVQCIKEKIRENPSTEKSINLFHCLNELNDHSLVQEVQTYLSKGSDHRLSGGWLSPAQWSALVFVLLNSAEELDDFVLNKYHPSEECLLRMLPVVKASRKAVLCVCNLTEKCCAALASALNSSSLKELNLSNNKLQDLGVKLLSAGLISSHCKLEKLWMCGCSITKESCETLASVLSSENSNLKELNLGSSELQDAGLKMLSAGLENPHCKLETLRLGNCKITEEGCASLASALKSNPSHLKELDLNWNNPGESGVKQLSDLLEDPRCNLEILQLGYCSITEKGCVSLASALKSNTSSQLRELNLNLNNPRQSGVKVLSELLEDPHCNLETLYITPDHWILQEHTGDDGKKMEAC